MFIKQTLILMISLISFMNPSEMETGSNFSTADAEEMVKRHNKYRKDVGVKSLKWSNEAATYAQKWANHLASSGCELEHSINRKFGENIFWTSAHTVSSTYVVDSWGSEKSDWKGGKITYRNYQDAGHYTQMIWHSTTKVGCGKATCSDGSTMVVCSYDPPGNVVGQNPIRE